MRNTEVKRIEDNLRRKLSGQGYKLNKSRVRNTSLNNCGGYMISCVSTNCIEAGERFDLSLDDVVRFANS